MPLIPVLLVAGGFAGGFWAGNGLSNLTKLALVGGAGYLIYTQVAK
ncbi:hypothetical protein [Bowmanella denitrificans]|nr:hypothetical protein [Bowmanella denitrificans]